MAPTQQTAMIWHSPALCTPTTSQPRAAWRNKRRHHTLPKLVLQQEEIMHKDSRLLILRLQLETGCGQRNPPAEIPIAMPCVRGKHEQVV